MTPLLYMKACARTLRRGLCEQRKTWSLFLLSLFCSPLIRIVDGVSKESSHRGLRSHCHGSRKTHSRIRRKPAAECETALFIPAQSEPMNGLRALVAHTAGNKCPRGWGIAKPAVYSGLQGHIISLLRPIRKSRTRRPVSPAAAE